jgi:hypothetical protein
MQNIELVIRYIIYPLVTSVVALVVFLYRGDVKRLKAEITNSESVNEKLSEAMATINIQLARIEEKIDAQDEKCTIRHNIFPWSGSDRRDPATPR